MPDRVIPLEDLSPETFAPYGRVVQVPSWPAPKTGPGWECWYGLEDMNLQYPLALGVVTTRPRAWEVDVMERHSKVAELLWTLDHDLIQPVGLAEHLDDPGALPNPETVRAYRIRPGQAIIMNPGVWHSAAIPLEEPTVYFFASERYPNPPEDPTDPWRLFPKGERVIIRNPARGALKETTTSVFQDQAGL